MNADHLAGLPHLCGDPLGGAAALRPPVLLGWPVVVILALGMLVGTAAGPVDIALLMLGRSVQSLRNNMAALVTNLVLNVLLIPRLGTGPPWRGRPRSWCRTRCPPGRSALHPGQRGDRTTGLVPPPSPSPLLGGAPPLAARALAHHPLGLLAASALGGLLYLALLYRLPAAAARRCAGLRRPAPAPPTQPLLAGVSVRSGLCPPAAVRAGLGGRRSPQRSAAGVGPPAAACRSRAPARRRPGRACGRD
ncbi:MAG: hypothetical protein R2734_14590 [Nocardioides sp.]